MPSDEEDRKNFGFVPTRAELDPILPEDDEDETDDENNSDDDDEEQI